MTNIDLTLPQGAIFSEDRKYRYALWRIWSQYKPLLLFCGLNPSIANETASDPTVTRQITRAYNNEFGGLLVVNLFAYVSTDRTQLLKCDDPVGELTDYYIREMVRLSSVQLCAWGSYKAVKKRAPIVYDMMVTPVCLGVNRDGEPIHPLYVSYEQRLEEYRR